MQTVLEICDNLSDKKAISHTKVRFVRAEIFLGGNTEQTPYFRIDMPKTGKSNDYSRTDIVYDLFCGVQDCLRADSKLPDEQKYLSVVARYSNIEASDPIVCKATAKLTDDQLQSFEDFFSAYEKAWSNYSSDALFAVFYNLSAISPDESITSADMRRIARSITFNNRNNFDSLLNDWLVARENLINTYKQPQEGDGNVKDSSNSPYSEYVELSDDFEFSKHYLIPNQHDIKLYLNTYYALLRETVRLSTLGEFALVDSDIEKLFLAISHPDCRLVNTDDGVRLEAAIFAPAILNSLYHNLCFLRCFSGIGSGYFKPIDIRSSNRLMNHAFMWMALDKMADNFRFSTVVGGLNGNLRYANEFLISPR